MLTPSFVTTPEHPLVATRSHGREGCADGGMVASSDLADTDAGGARHTDTNLEPLLTSTPFPGSACQQEAGKDAASPLSPLERELVLHVRRTLYNKAYEMLCRGSHLKAVGESLKGVTLEPRSPNMLKLQSFRPPEVVRPPRPPCLW